MSLSLRHAPATYLCALLLAAVVPGASAQDAGGQAPAPQTTPDPQPAGRSDSAFTLGEIVTVLGQDPGDPGIGGSIVTRDEIQRFERTRLDEAVNLVLKERDND
jgi:hypothetical protein